ncbi:TlpA family protein disulfide reductase [Brachybacterium sp. AOP25-B2-12]|uniref:TlpA family protein disulfide reductase n=1 Tax=Brachybacterium sp. AOP25-B2-12 TaxID=3457710 RepID=UPI004033ADD1
MSATPRRRILQAGALAATGALLAACATDTSDRYGTDTGFVSGDGVATEIDAADRGEPIAFTGTTYEGDAFSAEEQRGHVLVLNVWYAACAPCRKEAPELATIARDYADKDVTFLGINVRDAAGPAQSFEKNFDVPYPSVPDTDAQIMYALRGQVAPNAVPSTLVLDPEGRVAARISGLIDASTLRSMIDRVLGA